MSRDWKYEFPSRRSLFLTGGGIVFAGLTARLAELQLFRSNRDAGLILFAGLSLQGLFG
jgi:hypothetical protein